MPLPMSMRSAKAPAQLVVRALNASAQRGWLQFGPYTMPCALGRSGVTVVKREGDGATPRGRFPVRRILFKPGSGMRPRTAIDMRLIEIADGWCDSPFDGNYNRPVRLPYRKSAEHLWRGDGLYDLVVVLGYNDVPRSQNRGSAIFMHVARAGFAPTEGCIALRPRDLRRLLAVMPRGAEVVIEI